MDFIETSSKLRSDEDLIEARTAIQTELIKGQPNPAMIYYPIIIECISELLQRRKNVNLN